ncbi:MAG: hypothetical protein ACKVRO_18450 [Micropepsaceae bacterium]
MSVDFAYVNRAVDAAFALVVRDRRAWDKFDITVEGFYRSFAAFLVVLPMNLIADIIATQVTAANRLSEGKPALEQAYGLGDAIFSTVALSLQWMIFPLAMLFVLRFLGLSHRYVPLIVAHNWGTIVVYLFNMPAFLLFAAGFISAEDAIALNFMTLIFTLYYRYYTAETALDAGWSVAASVAMLGFVLQIYFALGLSFAAGLWLPAAQ